MSDEQNKVASLEDHPVYGAPGCGFASYGCLLLILFIVGIIGIVSSSFALLQAGLQREPYSLTPGNLVEVWRLQPMRDAGLLDLTEVPEAYHDESSSGITACALNDSAVLRLEKGQGWRIPYTAIQQVSTHREGDTMVAVIQTVDDERLSCFFMPGEGVERFVRAVKAHL